METLITFLFVIWIIGGAIVIATFYCNDTVTLPAAKPYKTVVALIAGGPCVWIVSLIIVGAIRFKKWIEK